MQEMQERPQAGDGQTAELSVARRGATNQPISQSANQLISQSANQTSVSSAASVRGLESESKARPMRWTVLPGT